MPLLTKSRFISLNIVIFFLPFLEFVRDNINEKDIILTNSFLFLITVLGILILIASSIIFYLKKKINFYDSLLISTISFYLLFKHNFFKTIINNFIDSSNSKYDLSSEASLILIIIFLLFTYKLIIKKNIFFIRFFNIFFYLSLIFISTQIFFNQDSKKKDLTSKTIFFETDRKVKKNNVYFVILDAMIPIKNFEKYYDINLENFLINTKKLNYQYIHNTDNLYDNTTHNLSSLFYLDKIDKNNNIPSNNFLYPSMLKNIENTNLFKNLSNLGYEFKWVGNLFAYCPKFNLRYCLDRKQDGIIDVYLYLNFLQKSPIIPIATYLVNFSNLDLNKYLYFDLNDGIGRLLNYLKSQEVDNYSKPSFYFIHHMSPHYPYVTNEDCSYKYFPGKKNFEGYKSAYLCNLNKINKMIKFLNNHDPDAMVVFQSDHSWIMSRDNEEKKMIFNLIKTNKECQINDEISYHQVNTIRLILSCITNKNPKYLNN
jgi:hypothetical protein